MKGYSFALAAVFLLALVGDHVIFAQNAPCDPDRDRRNPNLQAAKEAKKAELRRAGYPERFMKLIDQEECIACVRQASDAFHIMIVYKDNDYAPKDAKTGRHWTHVSTSWDPQSELIAREKTKDGTIKGYYISNTLQRNCHCCPEIDKDMVTPQDYSDWNEDLQANTSHLIPFDQSNTTGPPPDDLINPPSQWIDDPVPNIETFQKPARKQVTTPCPQCAGEALKLNDAYRALDELWDQRVSLQNEQSILEHAEAMRRNDISRLYYKQSSPLTRTPDGDTKMQEAERAQEADMAQMRANVLELDQIGAKLTTLMPQISQLEQVLLACAQKCTTTAPNDAIGEKPPAPRLAAAPNSPPSVSPAPQRATGGRGPGPAPGVFKYFEAACPACDSDAVAARLAAEKLEWAELFRDLLQESLDSMKEELALLEKTKASMKPGFDASHLFVIAKIGELEEKIGPLGLDVEGAKVTVQQRRAEYEAAIDALDTCNQERCKTTTSELPPSPLIELAPPEEPKIDTSHWVENWTNCLVSNTCPPIGTDGGVPGNVPYPAGIPYVNLTDGNPWITSGNSGVQITIQIKIVDVIDPWSYPDYSRLMTVSQNLSSTGVWPTMPSDARQIWIPPSFRERAETWFNPLGLLARRLIDNIERWRGSVGPRPLITTRDLELIDRVSNVQAAGVPNGVHVLLTDRGGSTGKTLAMQILNLTGAPVALSSRSFAIQPIQPQAQQSVQQAFSRLAQAAPARLDLSAYCVEFLKQPPGPNTLFRLAPADVQQKYASMSKVLQSAYRVSKGNALHPDSNPAAYTDAIKQWALWTVEQNLNEARFTEAFLGHTKKNVEAAKQQWSKQAETVIRQVSPNRWRDIVKILQGAGVPVPR